MRFKLLVLILLSLSCLIACKKGEGQTDTPGGKRFDLKGEVIAVDKAKKTATIRHEAVAGYMEAMTMDFPIREDWVWEDLVPGSDIRAELVVDDANGTFWLEKIAIVAAPNPNRPAPPVNENFAQVGGPVPDFTLTNQDGRKISAKEFRGKA